MSSLQLSPTSLTVTRRGNCEGMDSCHRMQFPGVGGDFKFPVKGSLVSLGQAHSRETPSSCQAISFQLCPNTTVYSSMKAALTVPSPLLTLPLVHVCRYPIHEHLFPPSLEEFCAPLTSSSAPTRLAGGLSWLSFPHLLQSLLLD